MIYEYNANKYFIPASNTKLFTFYAGLKLLGDSIPGLKYSITGDSLVFWGTGDPSFLNPDLPESKILSFLKEREEKLFYLPPSYEEPFFGRGWAWNDYNSSYSTEIAAFPLYGNKVTFNFTPGKTVPRANPSYFQESLSHNFHGASNPIIKRDIYQNNFLYGLYKGNEKYSQIVPFRLSSQLVIELLSDTLKKEVKIIAEKPKNTIAETTLYSVPSDSIYKRMLEMSDNFLAEQVLLLAAGAISDTLKSDITIKEMKDKYLKDLPDEPKWIDGSGLSRYNLFTPRTMVKLLQKIKAEIPQKKLFSLMATGGKSGTLENSYKAEKPYIFAKTGTLKNNHSLSGYLKTKSGKLLVFSFMNSNYTVDTYKLKEEMEKILKNIYLSY